jgi:tRNA pseudouridine55 synthase
MHRADLPERRLAGMLLFDKPAGWTSHDAAEAFRRMLPKDTKVGHCGSLDPIATGLLILLVGPCTRLQAQMQGLDKVYTGKIRLGVTTDTGDVAGKVLAEAPVPALTLEEVQKALTGHLGTLEMDAPAYSAVKYKGKALYQYARKGLPVPKRPRVSKVYDWKAVSYEAPDVDHRLSCSSGTYVRSLAESLGSRLGCGGMVLTLRRESIANFNVADALTLETAKKLSRTDLEAMLMASLSRLTAFAAAAAAGR